MKDMKLDLDKLKNNDTTVWRSVDVEPTILDEDERLVEGRINTTTLDAYNTIVEPTGAQVEKYINYASVLFNHDASNLIGNAEEIEVADEYVDAKWKFLPAEMNSEIVEEVWELYKNGWLNGYSIGFVPLDWQFDTIETDDEDEDDLDIVRVVSWKLKEFSLTAIPANPDALARSSDEMKIWRSLADRTQGVSPTPVINQRDLTTFGAETSEKKIYKVSNDMTRKSESNLAVREVVSYQDLPIEEDDWDADEAEANVREWAGGPDKEDVDWDKYFKAFFWRDGDEPELFGSYKLGYADVYGGELRAVDRGIYAVAAVLEGARGGVDIPEEDEASIRNQVEKYYDKMEETAPWNQEDSSEPDTPEEEENDMSKEEIKEGVVEALEEEGLLGSEKSEEELEERVKKLEENDTVEKEIDDLWTELSELRDSLDELREDHNELDEEIAQFVQELI